MKNENWRLTDEQYGPLLGYVKQNNITNIDWDCGQLWIKQANQVRKRENNKEITETFMLNFAHLVAQHESKTFNPIENVICADTDMLRITCVHPSFSRSGLSISIRKSLPQLRFTAWEAIENGYCDRRVMHLLANCVLAKFNFAFCGEPGQGKTEAAKFFSNYIPAHEKVITVEDICEWHYSSINPGKDCIELKINNDEEYQKALATALRLNPSWIMLAETRSREVRYLLESWSNGVSTMTTLHVGDSRDISDRILNMLASREDSDRIVNQIYNNVGISILLEEEELEGGKTRHVIKQVCFNYRKDEKNGQALVVDDGVLHEERLPEFIKEKIQRKAQVNNAFHCPIVERQLNKEREAAYDREACKGETSEEKAS